MDRPGVPNAPRTAVPSARAVVPPFSTLFRGTPQRVGPPCPTPAAVTPFRNPTPVARCVDTDGPDTDRPPPAGAPGRRSTEGAGDPILRYHRRLASPSGRQLARPPSAHALPERRNPLRAGRRRRRRVTATPPAGGGTAR